MTGIYKIENKINHKCYIGQSIDITRRWQSHRYSAFHENTGEYDSPLHRAMRKYGLENFEFSVLENCKQEELDEKEIKWIKTCQSLTSEQGYNLTPGGNSSSKFIDAETIKKLWDEGKTIPEIRKETEYNEQTIRRYLGDLYDGKEGSRRASKKMIKTRQHPIRQYDLEGNFLAEYSSLTELVEKTGLDKRHIPEACRGKQGRKTYAGYQWRYVEDPPPGPATHWRRKFLDSEVLQWRQDYQNKVRMIPELYKKYHPNCSQGVFYNIVALNLYYKNVLVNKKEEEGEANGA